MNSTKTKALFLAVIVALFTSYFERVNAALVISNWHITGNTLTYDIRGTIDSSTNIGPISPNRLYIGVPGDTDWVTANGVVSSVVNHPGATRIVKTPRYLNSVNPTVASDYTWLDTSDFNAYAVGDFINASVTAGGGTLIGANIVKEDIIVAIGYTDGGGAWPQVTHQAGAFVPEPSSALLLGFGCLALVGRRSRR